MDLGDIRRAVAACGDREEARRLYDQLRDLTAQLARRFSFGRRVKRR